MRSAIFHFTTARKSPWQMGDNTQPLALITGSSEGIGLELARLIIADGFKTILCGSSAKVHSVAEEFSNQGRVSAVQSDLTTAEGAEKVINAVAGRPLDVLVLNAGIALGGAFLDVPLERHLQLVEININSTLRLCHGLLPPMIARGRGKLLLVSSLSATTPTPFESIYGPSKSFMTSFGHGLREELRGTGVDVTILHPGATATDFHIRAGMGNTRFGDNSWKNDPAEVARQGYEALKNGVTSLIGGDADTQAAGRALRAMTDEDKARRQAAMSRPA